MQLALPDVGQATVVASAPGDGPGNWAGAPAVWRDAGVTYLAYRVRRPLEHGRGVGVVLARSDDGVRFDQVATIHRDLVGAASLERPALIRLADGRWRLYLSCSTSASKHWWVEALTAESVAALPAGEREVVLPGDVARVGVKDPVIVSDGDGWRMWLCCHPLDVVDAEDRMTTRQLSSLDGLSWTDQGEVLAGRPGEWDARGARVTAVLSLDPLVVTYDGRPDAASNWYETTGVAQQREGLLVAVDRLRARSPFSDGALRYAAVVDEGERRRWYVEAARPDGAHDLVTVVTAR